MSDSTEFQPLKHQWVELDLAGLTSEFLLQNKSLGEMMYIKVGATAPTDGDTKDAFKLVGGASMNRISEGRHWVWVWDHIESSAFVLVG